MNCSGKINVCVACDDNYARHAAVVVASILKNAKRNDNLCIYVLDGGIAEINKQKILSLKYIKDCEINFVKIDNEMFSEYLSIKTHSYLSVAAYYRLKLPTILPNVGKIIYFDCDVVVNTSLRELFNTDMGDCVVAGVRDIDKRKVQKNKNYVNSGMLVFDVKKMAELGVEKQFVDWTREHFETIKLGDQEIINEVLKGKIKVVDDEWNVQSSNFVNRSSYTNNPKIIHFVSSKKPWHFGSFSYHKDYYFKYLQLTPWALQMEEDEKYWIKWNKICSFFGYLKYRPLFFLRPRFYEAVFETYLSSYIKYIYSISNYNDTHNLIRIFGFKIKFPKKEFVKKQKANLFYYYKKYNIDITIIPQADGQLRNIQLANLKLLEELDYVCRKNGLSYWLDFGTLLGAVRHKGFIPWDDDIDVGMGRTDYEQLIKCFNKSTRNTDISADDVFISKNQCIIKVFHKKCPFLFVDIFPYDFSTQKMTEKERKAFSTYLKNKRKKLDKDKSLNSIDRIKNKILQLNNQIYASNIQTNVENICYGLDYNFAEPIWVHDYKTFFPLGKIEFEKQIFMCPKNPQEYLSNIMPNYMEYPKKIGFGHSMYLNMTQAEKNIVRNLIEENIL